MIDKIIFKLSDLFPEHDWDIRYDEQSKKYCILVNDYDFYMKDKKFRRWLVILRKKYRKCEFFCAYKNF